MKRSTVTRIAFYTAFALLAALHSLPPVIENGKPREIRRDEEAHG